MAVKSYRDLTVWQKAMDMVEQIYRLTAAFPREEQYGLTNQLRRAAVSVPSNIAEGQGRGVGNEFAHHVRIAQGSLQEVETQLLIASRLRYLSGDLLESVMPLIAEVGRLNRGLHKSIC
ncbi:MAG TPA: four helix bundle protein [Humisphaera sp.]|jgi:four helix bundle protein|nr:four helix bundle protein [Humisphaera sp.]